MSVAGVIEVLVEKSLSQRLPEANDDHSTTNSIFNALAFRMPRDGEGSKPVVDYMDGNPLLISHKPSPRCTGGRKFKWAHLAAASCPLDRISRPVPPSGAARAYLPLIQRANALRPSTFPDEISSQLLATYPPVDAITSTQRQRIAKALSYEAGTFIPDWRRCVPHDDTVVTNDASGRRRCEYCPGALFSWVVKASSRAAPETGPRIRCSPSSRTCRRSYRFSLPRGASGRGACGAG